VNNCGEEKLTLTMETPFSLFFEKNQRQKNFFCACGRTASRPFFTPSPIRAPKAALFMLIEVKRRPPQPGSFFGRFLEICKTLIFPAHPWPRTTEFRPAVV